MYESPRDFIELADQGLNNIEEIIQTGRTSKRIFRKQRIFLKK